MRPAYLHRQPITVHAVLGVILAIVIAIAATLALVHWAACSQETALCLAVLAAPRRSMQQAVARWRAWARAIYLRWLIRCAEADLRALDWQRAQLQRDVDAYPGTRGLYRLHIDALRVHLIDAMHAARGDA